MTTYDELRRLVEQWAPGSADELSGPTGDEIRRYKKEIPRLPPAVEEFAATFGRGVSWLGETNTNLDDVLDRWDEVKEVAGQRVLVAVDDSGGGFDFYRHPSGRVVQFSVEASNSQHGLQDAYESLPQLAYGLSFLRLSFERTAWQRMSVQVSTRDRDQVHRALDKLARTCQLEELPYSGSMFGYWDGPESAVCHYQPHIWAPFIQVAAETEQRVRELAAMAEELLKGAT